MNNDAEKMILQCITEIIIHRAVENKFRPIEKFVNIQAINSNLLTNLQSEKITKVLNNLVDKNYLNIKHNGKGYLNSYYLNIKGFKEWEKNKDYLVRDYNMYE